MIDKTKLSECVERALEGSDLYIVDITVSPDNVIDVEIDGDSAVDIDACVKVNRAVEAEFDRDVEDYELMVGSAGLTSPLKVRRQYVKNIGNRVVVLTRDGRKLHGTLTDVSEDGEEFTVTVATKVKEPGKKRPTVVDEPVTLKVADTKEVRYDIDFK
ncbi:MAG: ribosome assembly cofactor RimP [Bacteroides sp.]|nr:ribosome assembly cofactor RimP [Barnesiella sp.]MBD5314866.1 ribosome assembly cofactor RimP [Bacteroides sp.]MDE6248401.1 ribosome assembly cofactor RimP [Paramuribaculum sp.]MDE7450109.1 ribosome assembly cofactor RimP [Paramuribaculum sp.]